MITNATEPTSKLLWLASYPKTGSTWLREILTNILAPQIADRNTAIAAFQKEWPENLITHKIWGQDLNLVKTHLYPRHTRMEKMPLTAVGAILIRRHPLDILLSSLNYARIKGKESAFLNGRIKAVEDIIADGEFSFYIDGFKKDDGFSWFAGPSGELSLYMDRWRSFAEGKRYFEICYEDLFADPEQGIQDLLNFLEIEATTEEIAFIHQVADRRTAKNEGFFWKRRAYNFQEMLPPALIDEFHEKCVAQLKAFRYPLHP